MRTRTKAATFGAAILLMAAPPAMAQEFELSPSEEGASVRIISPEDGATVSNPVTVVFGLTGMGVAPAGVNIPTTGHHHLILNTDLPAFDQPIPATEVILHYGAGQTETKLELEPGEHTLQLLFGDFRHIPHDPPLISEKITITVE
ncbi:MAG: DUF4399 domain-containing protein [Pseudomonadota bacterium]